MIAPSWFLCVALFSHCLLLRITICIHTFFFSDGGLANRNCFFWIVLLYRAIPPCSICADQFTFQLPPAWCKTVWRPSTAPLCWRHASSSCVTLPNLIPQCPTPIVCQTETRPRHTLKQNLRPSMPRCISHCRTHGQVHRHADVFGV